MTKDKLTDDLSQELEEAFPGVVFNFSQMIGDNVEEAVAGVKGENSIKVYQPDLMENEKNADTIVDALAGVPGITDLGKLATLGQPDVKITPDRESLRSLRLEQRRRRRRRCRPRSAGRR